MADDRTPPFISLGTQPIDGGYLKHIIHQYQSEQDEQDTLEHRQEQAENAKEQACHAGCETQITSHVSTMKISTMKARKG